MNLDNLFPGWRDHPYLSHEDIRRFVDSIDFFGPDHPHDPTRDTCWLWTGSVHYRHGYGKFRAQGNSFGAHREAKKLYLGRELCSTTEQCLHTCDNRLCVNPNHLRLGTNAENTREREERGKSSVGEGNGRCKLTEAEVLVIAHVLRFHHRHGIKAFLGRRFGISPRVIGNIQARDRWAHILKDYDELV